MNAKVVLTVAALTIRETGRRRVLRSLGILTVLLLGVSAWGFSRLVGLETHGGPSPAARRG